MNAVLRSILFIAVICALIFIACSFGKKASYKNVGTDEFERLIADKAVQILDSRSKAEYDEGHIEGAILIDVNDPSFKTKAGATLSKDKPVAVYCRSGRRSRVAADILSKEGYKVTNLDGGIITWNAAGKPTVR